MKMEEAFDLATEVADFATMLPMWEAWPNVGGVACEQDGDSMVMLWLCMVVDSNRAAVMQNDQDHLYSLEKPWAADPAQSPIFP
jgi:hypothetical protein